MTLNIEIIDDLFKTLPKEIVGIIYIYYDTRCKNCQAESILCSCDEYYHAYHYCFGHRNNCTTCIFHRCPFSKIRISCDCCGINKLCETCRYKNQ